MVILGDQDDRGVAYSVCNEVLKRVSQWVLPCVSAEDINRIGQYLKSRIPDGQVVSSFSAETMKCDNRDRRIFMIRSDIFEKIEWIFILARPRGCHFNLYAALETLTPEELKSLTPRCRDERWRKVFC